MELNDELNNAAQAMRYGYLDVNGKWVAIVGTVEPDYALCADEVHLDSAYRTMQCRSPRGHGPAGLFCQYHAAKLADRAKRWGKDAGELALRRLAS